MIATTTAPAPLARRALPLRDTLAEWYRENARGGWKLRWRRRPVWLAQIAQRIGLQYEASAPLFFGERMRVLAGERISSALLTFGYSECALTAVYLGLLGAGDTVIDVGTHFGYEALLAAHLVGESGAVFAFEPNPVAHRMAAKNLAARPQCHLTRAAAGDQPGTARLRVANVRESAFAAIGDDATAGVAGSVAVPVTTVDGVLGDWARPVRVLKIDAEGYELPVLRGARQTIARHRPVIVAEVGMRGGADGVATRTAELVECAGIELEAFDFEFDGRLHIGAPGTLAVGHANIALVPPERRDEFLSLADS